MTYANMRAILKFVGIHHLSGKTFKTLIIYQLSFAQTVQKCLEMDSYFRSLCIFYAPLIDNDIIPFLLSEAVIWRSSLKEVALKILQNS